MDAAGTLVLIPAKGGSTRLLRKNIRHLGGRPLIEWTIAAALEAGVGRDVIVSTDDGEVADVSRRAGAAVPFVRPAELSRDPAGVVDVALHALAEMEAQGKAYRTLVILLPTCPLRSAADILAARDLFMSSGCAFLMSVSRFDHTPFAALALSGEKTLKPYFPAYIGKKSQEMPAAFRANGAVHIVDVAAFKQSRSYYTEPLAGYEMPIERSVDIDTEFDLTLAEALLSSKPGRT